ncbi:MAG TPA: hypothetical protein VF628_02260 [Allosphingosinicella sp.]|jgi:hypothetical protein
MDERIKVNERQLAAALSNWLRTIPKQVWDRFIEHKILQHYKRSSLQAQQLEGQIADHVASEMTRLDWQVTHPANGNIFSDANRHARQHHDDRSRALQDERANAARAQGGDGAERNV